MKTHLTRTKYDTYKYIRRVPKQLLEYTTKASFRVSLGSNQLEATQQALEFNNAIDEALQLSKLGVDRATIIEKMEHFLPQESIKGEVSTEEAIGTLQKLSTEYLYSQEANISKEETRDKKYFYEGICTHIFEHIGLTNNPTLESINYNHLLQFRDIITQLPKRNIQKYREMDISRILKNIKAIQEEDKLSARSINKYIKWLRALFNFAVVLGYIQVNLATSLPLQKTIDEKLQRLPLDESELEILLESVAQKMQYLLAVLAFTGMRLSELYKCEVVEINGIKCFSLLNRNVKLKTKSSYRVIPVHHSLLEGLEHFYHLRDVVSSNNLARTVSDTIKRLELKDMEKKSLYSLRHRFATQLIQKGANASIVSELMGHSHRTMTLSRYSTGFRVEQLREVVELL
ncbi:tyrosine-type recombinase/integrase [Sulfurimonas sp.]|nr:tyrosine-type recombinase/integrase [Sulfurimonas sp.]